MCQDLGLIKSIQQAELQHIQWDLVKEETFMIKTQHLVLEVICTDRKVQETGESSDLIKEVEILKEEILDLVHTNMGQLWIKEVGQCLLEVLVIAIKLRCLGPGNTIYISMCLILHTPSGTKRGIKQIKGVNLDQEPIISNLVSLMFLVI